MMSLPPSLASKDVSDQPQTSPPLLQCIRCGPLFFIALALVVLSAIIWQVWYQQQTGVLVGRPLASSQTHLHDVTISRSGTVYLGTHFGLFSSANGGHTWSQRRGALATTMVTSIAVSLTNPDLLAVVAIPTGVGQQMGVYMSADAGKTWHFSNPTGLSSTAYPYRIQAATGADGHFFVFFSGVGCFETSDLGRHWSQLIGDNLATIQNPSLITTGRDSAHLLIGGDPGLFETINDGRTWQAVAKVQGSVLSLTTTTGQQAQLIFCATDQGLYRGQEQSDGQITWSEVSLPTAHPPARVIVNAEGSALYALFGSDLWFSTNQGRTWVLRWHFTRSDLVALVLDPTNPQQLLAGFFWPGLVLSSMDQGKSWQILTD